MCRGVISFILLLCLVSAARPDQADPDKTTLLKQAEALQKLVQAAIRTAEPAIAGIAVSRSDAYERYGQAPSLANPGRLGGFDPEALAVRFEQFSLTAQERDRIRRRLDLADPANVPESLGGGVFIDETGLVLTYYHVIQGAKKIFVRWAGSAGSYADIHAADPRSDLAVLRLLKPDVKHKTLTMGDGSKADRGQLVLALAHSRTGELRTARPSASLGIISSIRRLPPDRQLDEEAGRPLRDRGPFLQTDVRLSLGFSGGALLNLRGELIGLGTVRAAVQSSDAGVLAVPLDASLRRIIEVLKRGEEVEYGFLGVSFDRKNDAGQGVILNRVTPGSPAHLKGLRARDVILAVNGAATSNGDDLFHSLGGLLAGSTVTLDVRKAGRKDSVQLDVRLAKCHVPGNKIASSLNPRPFFRGLRVDYTSLLVQKEGAGAGRIPAGVLVSEVRADSSAATALLRPGDIVTHVNGLAVDTPSAFYQAVGGRVGPVELTLAGARPGQVAPKVVLN
jgi:serine protease Do